MPKKKLKKSGSKEPYIPDYDKEVHEKPIYEFNPGFSGHEWKQQGPYIICFSCEMKHAMYIGINKIMVGINDDGMPLLEDR